MGEQGLTGVTGAGGGGVGAGARGTGFGQTRTRTSEETRLTLLTVGALGVSLTVQAHSYRTKRN